MKITKWKAWRLAFVSLFVLGLLVTVVGVARASVDVRSFLLTKLVDKVPAESAERLLAQLLGATEEEQLGLAVPSSSNTGLTNVRIGGVLQIGSSSSTLYFNASKIDTEIFPSSTTTIAIQNTRTSSSTVQLQFDMTGTGTQIASSTFTLNCGTSTISSISVANTIPPSGLIDTFVVATGTQQVISSWDNNDNGTLGRAAVIVAPNAYITCSVRTGIAGGYNYCNPVACETTTSTSRGWRATVRAFWQWDEGL